MPLKCPNLKQKGTKQECFFKKAKLKLLEKEPTSKKKKVILWFSVPKLAEQFKGVCVKHWNILTSDKRIQHLYQEPSPSPGWSLKEAITWVICEQLLIFLPLWLKLFWFLFPMATINTEHARSVIAPNGAVICAIHIQVKRCLSYHALQHLLSVC